MASIIKSIPRYISASCKTKFLLFHNSTGKYTSHSHGIHLIRAQSASPMAVITPHTSILNQRKKTFYYLSYASHFGSRGGRANNESEPIPPPSASVSDDNQHTMDDLVHFFNSSVMYLNHSLDSAQGRIKMIVDQTSPHVSTLVHSHPYLGNVVAPIGFTLTSTVLAWVVMPRVFRRIHKYTTQGPTALLSKGFFSDQQVPYERSMWAALEEPVRYLITFMAFSQIGEMVAPSTIASEYISKSWRGAIVLSFVWFLYRWKTNVFSRNLAFQSMEAREREKLQTLDKLSSVGLFVLGLMALSEACGVAVQSIITVGGIGGVATAFAARDILGNVLSGLSMQFSKPFSLGDTIKAGSIEGQVADMGFMTTILLNADKHPVIVPNSLFSSQVIVNKSRARWIVLTSKIPLRIDDVDKIPKISEDIKTMLKSSSKVFLEKEAPYCFLSRIDGSFAELSIGCNLIKMSKQEWYSTEQNILIKSAEIIKQHGARLGSNFPDVY